MRPSTSPPDNARGEIPRVVSDSDDTDAAVVMATTAAHDAASAPDMQLTGSAGKANEAPDSVDINKDVRAADEDRWLASRFAPKLTRPRLITLYALANDIARAADRVGEPLLAQMRLTWWRGALEAMLEGRDAALPPTVRALGEVHREAGLSVETLLSLADARVDELGDRPFETWAALDSFVDRSAGGLTLLAIQVVDPKASPTGQAAALAKAAGRAWGYCGLLRAFPHWRAKGRSFFPKALVAHLDEVAPGAEGEPDRRVYEPALRAVMDRAVGAMKETRRLAVGAPTAWFPAYGYVTLVPVYLAAIEKAGLGESVTAPLLMRQWRLMQASLTGRL